MHTWSIRARQLKRDAFWRCRGRCTGFNPAAGTSMPLHPNLAALLRTVLCMALGGALRTDSALARQSLPKPETRCGWFVNPTSGNAWLIDHDGESSVGIQGGHQADGDWPQFRDAEWVVTNSGLPRLWLRVPEAGGRSAHARSSPCPLRPHPATARLSAGWDVVTTAINPGVCTNRVGYTPGL